MTRIGQNFIPMFFVFIILAFGLAFLMPNLPSLGNNLDVIFKSHAVEVHQADAEITRECLSNKTYFTFQNPTTGRILRCVEIEKNKWGIQVVEKVGDSLEEVTTFIKNKMTSFEKVMKYIFNSGYTIPK